MPELVDLDKFPRDPYKRLEIPTESDSKTFSYSGRSSWDKTNGNALKISFFLFKVAAFFNVSIFFSIR